MNNILKWSIIGGLFLVPFTPLFITSGLLFPFIVGKGFFFRIVVEIVFALYLILAVRDPEYRPKKSWLSAAVALFLVIVFVADIFGVNPHKSFWSNFERMEGFFMILHLWMFFMVASTMLVKKYWNYFMGTSVGVAILVSWYGLYQIAGKIDIRQGSDRLDGTLGNASYFAVYLLLNIGFALYLFLQAKEHKVSIKSNLIWSGVSALVALVLVLGIFPYFAAYLPIPTPTETQGVKYISILIGIGFWAALAGAIVYGISLLMAKISKTEKYNNVLYLCTTLFLFVYIIFKTSTRGTILGLAVAVTLMSLLYAWKAKHDKLGRSIALAIVLSVVVCGVGLVSLRKTDFVKNNTTLNRVASISFENARTKYIWPIAFQGIQENPILGYGQEGFNYAFNKYYNSAMWTEEAWFDRAHSVFIDWFVAGGVLGFASYVALYVLAFLYIWKGEYSLKEKTVLVGLLIAYAIHNMTVFDNISSYILFFALLAFLHSNKATHHIKKIDINVDVRDLVVVPAILIVFAGTLYYVNIIPIRVGGLIIDGMRSYPEGATKNIEKYTESLAYNVTGSQEAREQIIQRSEDIIRNTKDPAIQQMFFKLAEKAVRDQIAYAPLDARAYLLGGGFLNRLGQLDTALPILEKAHELTPNKQAPLFELISNQINRKKNDEALATAQKALALDPNFPEAQRIYGIISEYVKKNSIQK